MRSICRFVLTAFGLFAMACSGLAQSKPFFPYPFFEDTLPNRLHVVTIPTGNPGLVALQIVVRVGSRNEVEAGKSGFAHFFEHMMFRGSENYTPDQRDHILKSAGAEGNAYTADDRTVYHEQFSKDDLDQVMKLEADRFQRLKYDLAAYKTETLAVLGEYNKNSSNPINKLEEVLRATAFSTHTYKHTTMGFVEDIQDMPNQYDYSLQFYRRYYRPENCTVLIAGDITRERALELTRKYFADWKAGDFNPDIPKEPDFAGPKTTHLDWPSPTLPFVVVAYRGPGYSDEIKDKAALDMLIQVAFGEDSDLYQKLVLKEQKVDVMSVAFEDHINPELFAVYVRVKAEADLTYVQEQIEATVKKFAVEEIPAQKLSETRSRFKYGTALGLNSTEAVAAFVAPYIALSGSPATINRLFGVYESITPADIKAAVAKHLRESNKIVATLTSKAAANPSR